jgi:hypothetical protein
MKQQQNNKLNDKTLQNLNGKLSACKKVVDTITTKGWSDIIQPIIDKMISDVIGSKTGEVWDAGNIKKETFNGLQTEYLLGYRQALIDFNNRIWGYKAHIKSLTDQIINIESGKEVMVDTTTKSRYAPASEKING